MYFCAFSQVYKLLLTQPVADLEILLDPCEPLPKLNPWEPVVVSSVEKAYNWTCSHPPKKLSRINFGKLYIDYNKEELEFCRYRCFDKMNAANYEATFEKWINLAKTDQTSGTKVDCEFVDVSCDYKNK